MTTAVVIAEPRSEMSDLVHDLRSPLAAIEAAAHAVLGMGVEEPAVRRLIDLVAEEARSAQKLVDTALDHSRTQGEFLVGPVAYAVAARASTRWKGDVRVIDDAPSVTVAGSSDRCLRAISNLVDNAFQHGPSSSVIVRVSCRDDTVSITVTGAESWGRPRTGERSHGIGLRSVNRAARDLGGYHQIRVKDGCRVDELCLPRAVAGSVAGLART